MMARRKEGGWNRIQGTLLHCFHHLTAACQIRTTLNANRLGHLQTIRQDVRQGHLEVTPHQGEDPRMDHPAYWGPRIPLCRGPPNDPPPPPGAGYASKDTPLPRGGLAPRAPPDFTADVLCCFKWENVPEWHGVGGKLCGYAN